MVPDNKDNSFRSNFQLILDNYLNERTNKFSSKNRIGSYFQNLQTTIYSLINQTNRSYLIPLFSYGKGGWANVPWLSVLDKSRETSIQKGVYIVYLFKADMSGFYLTLNQGVTGPLNKGKEAGIKLLKTTADFYRKALSSEELKKLYDQQFVLNNDIFLSPSGLGAKYHPGTIIHKFYKSGDLPEEKILFNDLDLLIDIYTNLPRDIPEDSLSHLGEQQGLYDEEEGSRAHNYWIFQSNPRYYDIAGAVKAYKDMTFTVSRYKHEIKPGDTVFVWTSGSDAGILAVAEVTTPPFVQGIPPNGDPFGREDRHENETSEKVVIEIKSVLKNPLLKSRLQKIPGLNELSVMKAPQGTNFRVSKAEGDKLMKIIQGDSTTSMPIPQTQENRLPFDIKPFIIALKESNLQFDDLFVTRFVASLMAKRFAILTGLSGSGKTKLATTFAYWLTDYQNQVCLVPVGADWTNREPLLGFSNALVRGSYVKPDTGVIELLLRAISDSKRPYFLILDEMNLSHVERYFADFLSALESGESILLHPDEQDEWGACDVPATISLPENLFIIGTVNVDETTYMFSPKVLDRAFVHEFRVSSVDMRNFLVNPIKANTSQIYSAGANMDEDFLHQATYASEEFENSDILITKLTSFFDELKLLGNEFGYRTATEIYRFGAILNKVDDTIEINDIIDSAIVTKLLPKIHGSRRKLEQTLVSLFKLCLQEPSDEEINSYVTREKSIPDNENVIFPVSLDKIVRMYRQVVQDGFTSFSEA